MKPTRSYHETILRRIKRDPEFEDALFSEAFHALREGETGEGLSMLHDLVRARSLTKTDLEYLFAEE
jgi:hypothetical protein